MPPTQDRGWFLASVHGRARDKLKNDKFRARAENSVENRERRRGNPDKIKPYQFKPGQSGNPGGRPTRDHAADIAAAIFEHNSDEIYRAMCKALLKGDSRVFTALADRAFGKVKTHVSEQNAPVQVIIDNVNVADVNEP